MGISVNPKLIDGVEIYNASRAHKGQENVKAIIFAKEQDLAIQAGTDAHLPELEFFSGIKMKQRAESIFDIIHAIKEKKVDPILQPMEESLWRGTVENARKHLEISEVSEYWIDIFYD